MINTGHAVEKQLSERAMESFLVWLTFMLDVKDFASQRKGSLLDTRER